MQCLQVRKAGVEYPTGNKNFAVLQAFPSAFTAEEADPFLMCDEFGPSTSSGTVSDPDEFPVGWHPHCGQDIMTYLRKGTGRHADSMGNRSEFDSPGMQWCSVGSGIEHAEGGGTPAGVEHHGFQIWINVPAERKRDDPRYGTEPPSALPLVQLDGGGSVRVLAGTYGDGNGAPTGPFKTVQPVLMLDVDLPPGGSFSHPIPANLDSVLVYVHAGDALVAGTSTPKSHVARMDAGNPQQRVLTVTAASTAANADGIAVSCMVFAGKRLGEAIAWRGPFVLADAEQLRATITAYQRGQFPPVRVPWDYKRLAAFPKK